MSLIEVQALTQDHFGDEEVDAADGDIGKQNASEEYSQTSIKALTEKLEKVGWTFTYIGANQDAQAVSSSLGIKNAMNFEATACGVMSMSKKLTASRERWFERVEDGDATANEGFFEE